MMISFFTKGLKSLIQPREDFEKILPKVGKTKSSWEKVTDCVAKLTSFFKDLLRMIAFSSILHSQFGTSRF